MEYFQAIKDVANVLSQEQETLEYILVKLLEAKKISIVEYSELAEKYLPK